MRIAALDFSASKASWKKTAKNSNVWLALAHLKENNRFLVDRLCQPQSLSCETDSPFLAVAKEILQYKPRVLGIDAPLSVPKAFLPDETHSGLRQVIASLKPDDFDFPDGKTLAKAILPSEFLPYGKKLYRRTEDDWRRRVSTRSALWAGPRGGMGLLSAGVSLMNLLEADFWPVSLAKGLLVAEVFPAAQLSYLGLPTVKYDGPDPSARQTRQVIWQALKHRYSNSCDLEDLVLESGDALDALLGLLGGVGLLTDTLVFRPLPGFLEEGWIAVEGGKRP